MKDLTFIAGGRIYSGWTSVRITRNIERLTSDFELEVSERWAGQREPWQIPPMTPCQIKIGGDLVLTGYTDDYDGELDATSHRIRITGRSKTMDLVDCMAPIEGGQFNGSPLAAIAKAVAGFFNIKVVFDADVSHALPEATYELTETAFAYLDRLCTLSSVLALDDEQGNLVICQAGTAGAQGAVVEGQNGARFSATLSARDRFSDYAVLAQAGQILDGQNGLRDVLGEWKDPSVPRFRRFAEMAESAADNAMCQARAAWRAKRNGGRAIRVTATMLWLINQLVPVKSPSLWLDRTLLVVGVTYLLDDQGPRTELELSPQEAYTPEPAAIKLNATLSGNFWNSAKAELLPVPKTPSLGVL